MKITNRPPFGLRPPGVKPAPKISLAPGALFTQRLLEGESLIVAVLSGHVWLTNEGDPEDYVLAAGETFEIHGPASLLVEGIRDGAEFELELHHDNGVILAV